MTIYNIKFTNINFYVGFLGPANLKPQGFIKQVTPNCRVFGQTSNLGFLGPANPKLNIIQLCKHKKDNTIIIQNKHKHI